MYQRFRNKINKSLISNLYSLITRKSGGFTLIEIIVALGLAALILPALAYVFSFSITTSTQGGKYSQAYALAQENMEAVYYLKENWDWDDTSFNSNPGEYYQPNRSSGDWDLGSPITEANLVTDANGFTKAIQIDPVFRNASGEIDPSGAEYPETRKVVSKVSWELNGQEENLEIVSYVTKH